MANERGGAHACGKSFKSAPCNMQRNTRKWFFKECIFSFDYQSEREIRVALPPRVVNPILCVLGNKLWCAFFIDNRLTIHQLIESSIWTILIDVTVNPPIRYLPICLQGELLLLAFRGELLGEPAFINHVIVKHN
jgi:hypothetical protein